MEKCLKKQSHWASSQFCSSSLHITMWMTGDSVWNVSVFLVNVHTITQPGVTNEGLSLLGSRNLLVEFSGIVKNDWKYINSLSSVYRRTMKIKSYEILIPLKCNEVCHFASPLWSLSCPTVWYTVIDMAHIRTMVTDGWNAVWWVTPMSLLQSNRIFSWWLSSQRQYE